MQELYMDYREFNDNPLTVKGLKELGIEAISEPLKIGDFTDKNKFIVEHKTLSDFVGSVKSSRIFQQAQDMAYNKDMHSYILVSGNLQDIFKLQFQQVSPEAISAAIASLNVIGVPTIFLSNQWFYIRVLKYLLEKYNDGKIRTYNPIRAPITSDDKILTNYMSIDDMGDVMAKRLKEAFPIPKSLYNATLEQLTSIDGIGKPTALKLLAFFNGEKV